jgi:hypothetical protein
MIWWVDVQNFTAIQPTIIMVILREGRTITMENTVEFYKSCIKQLLSRYESLKTDNTHIELIFDDKRMRYMADWMGAR